MFASAFVATMCGCFLFFVWSQHQESRAPLWWGAGNLLLGVGTAVLALGLGAQVGPLVLVGIMLLTLAPALTWFGVRAFHGKPSKPFLVGGGILAWIIIATMFNPETDDGIVAFLATPLTYTSLTVGYSAAIIWELLQQRNEKLRARTPLIVLVAINMIVALLAVPSALMGQLTIGEPPPLASLFGVIHFEAILYVVGMTIFLVAMMKERNELLQRRDAETDMLTKLPNRRAFVSKGERLVERCRRDKAPFAVATFDLDHFKAINDTFGHSIGDRTLQLFAQVATEALRPNDVISRVGGEEFTAILPAAGLQAGCALAERVRQAFEQTGAVVDGKPIGATVSAGVTATEDTGIALSLMLERADEALYKAKLAGRNRIECANADCAAKNYPRLVRVA